MLLYARERAVAILLTLNFIENRAGAIVQIAARGRHVSYAIPGRILKAVVAVAFSALASPVTMAAQQSATLHATITVSGGITFSGSFVERLPVRSCADAAKSGTNAPGAAGGPVFAVPMPPPAAGGNPGPVGGGHTFMTDAAAMPYHGPGTYTGSGLNATQMDVDTPPGSQDTHIFAFPTGIGTLIVRPDASGSFEFTNLQDPGDVRVSGQVVWTCS
jgi:hypothetical protein